MGMLLVRLPTVENPETGCSSKGHLDLCSCMQPYAASQPLHMYVSIAVRLCLNRKRIRRDFWAREVARESSAHVALRESHSSASHNLDESGLKIAEAHCIEARHGQRRECTGLQPAQMDCSAGGSESRDALTAQAALWFAVLLSA